MLVLCVECKVPRSLGKYAYHRFQGLLLEPVHKHPERGTVAHEHDVLPITLSGQLR
jgi:hypothetical protein